MKRGLRDITPAFIEKAASGLNFSDSFFAYISMERMTRRNRFNLEEQVQQFLIAKQVEGKSPVTLNFYRENLGRFSWWVQHNRVSLDISKIQVQHLRSFLAYIQTTPNRWNVGSTSSQHLPSMATVDVYWRSLQSFFAWLVKEGVIEAKDSPMKKLPRPKVPKKIVEDIPLDLVRRAIDEFDGNTLIGARNRAIILMLLDTGIRLSECSNLTLADINLDTGLIRVWGKGGKQRLVRLGEIARQAMEDYLILRGSNTGDSLWVIATSLSPSTVSRA